MTYNFSVIRGEWAVVRLPPGEAMPHWSLSPTEFTSITRTSDELSIVCPASMVPDGQRAERDWTLLKLHGPFPFDQVGVLASFATPLAEAKISIFALSTFDTDYILVKASKLDLACRVLVLAGHELVG